MDHVEPLASIGKPRRAFFLSSRLLFNS